MLDYPALNRTGQDLIVELLEDVDRSILPEARDADLFDVFSHWLVAIKKFFQDKSKGAERRRKDQIESAKKDKELPDDKAEDAVLRVDRPFSKKTFKLLAELHENPTQAFYTARKPEFVEHLIKPTQLVFREVVARLPVSITERMETEKRIFANITKNDFGRGGAWDYYWGAFYPKGGKRIEDAQLFIWINRERIEYGFHIGEYGSDQRRRFLRNLKENQQALALILQDSLDAPAIVFGRREDSDRDDPEATSRAGLSWDDWLSSFEGEVIRAATKITAEEAVTLSTEQLAERIASNFKRVYPLALLSLSDNPLPAISEYLNASGDEEEEAQNPEYSLEQCSEETGIDVMILERWVRAIERKGQAVLYGPPGTGKTHLAEKLSRHLTGGSNGVVEIVQFHPAYAYEDFILGIRPQRGKDGVLDYPTVQGRFLDFCDKAQSRKGRSVLIIDEINRAELARVFGELMYLLEYRQQEVPLAGGRVFHIPSNVRIIGTMNTADRSIALVDHALRRRFAFLSLYPDYEVLARFHAREGTPVEGLIETLKLLNREIDDRHYELGISFFLVRDLHTHIEDIWRTEIEPYIEEYFFDRPNKADAFGWDAVKGKILPQT